MYLLLISCARAKDLTGFSTFDTSKNPLVHKGGTYTVYGILTSIKLLIGLCHEALHHRFIACTNTARMLLVLLAGAGRDLETSPVHCPGRRRCSVGIARDTRI